jgi:ketosteroid isomerase-like protein
MSQENVDLVRASYEFLDRTRGVDTDTTAMDPDIEWRTRSDLPDTATYHGLEGVAKHVSDWFSAFDHLRIEVVESIDAGEHVIVVLHLSGRIRGSSQDVDMPETHVWKMRDGIGVEVREYQTKAEALKAVGLEE